ncbi:MAG: hypothetical protein WCF04_11210 [Candidatus Nanopelagicales bacterium]
MPTPARRLKSQYVRGARVLRTALGSAGVLGPVDRWAARSRTGLWARSLLSIWDVGELAELDLPWWTFHSAERVESFLVEHPGARVFEWGSGASTIWLARRSGSVVTVEHDVRFADAVRGLVPPGAMVDVRMIPLVEEPGAHPARPGPARPPIAGAGDGPAAWPYVSVIDEVGGTFDVIVIDGRARERCLVQAMPHLAVGGILVFDNVEQRRYRDAIAALDPPVDVTWTCGLTPSMPYPTRTAILRQRGTA